MTLAGGRLVNQIVAQVWTRVGSRQPDGAYLARPCGTADPAGNP